MPEFELRGPAQPSIQASSLDLWGMVESWLPLKLKVHLRRAETQPPARTNTQMKARSSLMILSDHSAGAANNASHGGMPLIEAAP